VEQISGPSDGSGRFEFSERTIHVWSIRLEAGPSIIAAYDAVLSFEERERAGRFKFPQLSQAFTISRGALRFLLSGYLGVPPESLEFEYGPQGKPKVSSKMQLEFNMSHSGGLALFAFTRNCPLGIDVEHIRVLRDLEDLARRFFCADESSELVGLPQEQREHAFFLCWTRKEAFIKAIGQGLSAPLDSFRVSLDPAEPARFLHLPESETGTWTLTNLAVATDYAAALAYPDSPRELIESPKHNPEDLLG
jgi:4'-phosphopantetheinyl transferase